MDILFIAWALFAFVLGTVLGSFLNVLLFRYHTGSGIGGRSHCMRCGHALGARDLVPVLSFVTLAGKCRYCGSRISAQYPLVELIAGFLSLGVFLQVFNSSGVISTLSVISYLLFVVTWLTLLFLVVYDTEHKVLPFEALGLLGALSLASLFFMCGNGSCTLAAPSGWGFAAGALVAAPLLFLSLISRGTWMGWGDGLLMLCLGWLLGITGGFTSLVLAFWSGAIIGLFLLAWSRWRHRTIPQKGRSPFENGFTMQSEIPFAPFLVLGAAAVYFFHVDIFSMFII